MVLKLLNIPNLNSMKHLSIGLRDLMKALINLMKDMTIILYTELKICLTIINIIVFIKNYL